MYKVQVLRESSSPNFSYVSVPVLVTMKFSGVDIDDKCSPMKMRACQSALLAEICSDGNVAMGRITDLKLEPGDVTKSS